MDRFSVEYATTSAAGDHGLQLSLVICTPKAIVRPALNILFVHATGYHKEMWFPIIGRLANENVRCIAYDIRYHGDSASLNAGKPVKDDADWMHHAFDILKLAGELEPPMPILAVGHSLGGTALLLAEHARPNTFARIITLDSVCGPLDPTVLPFNADILITAKGARRRRSRWPSRHEAKRSLLKNPIFCAWDEEVLNTYIQYGFADDLATNEVVLNLPGTAQENAERCLRGEYIVLEGTGHNIPMERPGEIAASIRHYIAAIANTRARL
ncbi:Alpha/Beta hydrolase protein [Thamnocephalis sphaerospora]|uniref:Alpha/Beta hydrolase protein n=1 Tax=Thamnocephalis sphaerospora TaxID=78915 RepID=A0A4P9XPD9_9FUNG|nr:Alpha/Beta hydrolase protein [Thamnocephalis sphaerospora]|eukprot:RKP07120.1 Alpha/Beta hydrolase protein [Thamnocephalis sphaerospora]